VLVLFGPGEADIVQAFQMTFVASLVFGVAQLLLADHDGGLDRRDALGLLCGLAALLCSGVAVTMVVVVGLAVVVRRGWRAAAFHVVPLAVAYGTWVVVEHPPGSPYGLPTAAAELGWVRSGETGTFLALGRFPVVAGLLAAMLVVGLVVAWAPLDQAELRRRAAAPGALLIGGVVFAAITAIGRWGPGAAFARQSRYLYIGAVLTLPALAVAADALVRRWRWFAPAAVALLVVAVPWNVTAWGNTPEATNANGAYFTAEQQVLLGALEVPFARELPGWVRPLPGNGDGQYDTTLGWLRSAERQGRLPDLPRLRGATVRELEVRLGVAQVGTAAVGDCHRSTQGVVVDPHRGARLGLDSDAVITLLVDGRPASPPVLYEAAYGHQLAIELPGLHLQVQPLSAAHPLVLCTELT
jgi:hypothetical protein